LTVILTVTWAAGLYWSSPVWSAVTVQVPAFATVRVLPDTVQTSGVILAKVTGLPEAPPVAVKVAWSPTAAGVAGEKLVMVWFFLVRVRVVVGPSLVVGMIVMGFMEGTTKRAPQVISLSLFKETLSVLRTKSEDELWQSPLQPEKMTFQGLRLQSVLDGGLVGIVTLSLTLATINGGLRVITCGLTRDDAWTVNGYGEFIEAVEIGRAEGARSYVRQLTIYTILITSPTAKNGIGICLGS